MASNIEHWINDDSTIEFKRGNKVFLKLCVTRFPGWPASVLESDHDVPN